MLSIASRLKKDDRARHDWNSEGIVKKIMIKKKRADGKTVSVNLGIENGNHQADRSCLRGHEATEVLRNVHKMQSLV